MSDHDAFFGELYLETTRAFLTPRLSAMEAEVLVALLGPRPGGRYLDLGCGHGRHVGALHERGVLGVTGLDRSAPALALARREQPGLPFVRGDYRDLPIRGGALAGAFAWYSGLFLFDEEAHLRILRELLRALEPGGRLVHDGANPARLAAEPLAQLTQATPAGRVEEVCRFDAEEGREHGWRRLTRHDGTILEGRWSVRHHDPEALTALLQGAGFELESLRDERGRDFDAARALDLVAVARRPSNAQAEE